MWVDGDVNGKDWSRRRGGLFKIVLDTELLNVAPLFHCRAQGCSQLARLETVSSKVSCLFLKDLPQMWTPDNWTAKRRAVICVIFFFPGKSNCMAIDHATGKYWIVCFRPKGFLALLQPVLVPRPLSSPPVRYAGVCNPPKSPSPPNHLPGPMQHKYLPSNLQVSVVSCCVSSSPRVPLLCVFHRAAKGPAEEGAVIPQGGGSGAEGPWGLLLLVESFDQCYCSWLRKRVRSWFAGLELCLRGAVLSVTITGVAW